MRRDEYRNGVHGVSLSAGEAVGERVSWLGRATPPDREARMVYEAIVKADLSRYGDVVTYVADSLYAEDYEPAGPTSDIGFFRESYCRLARRILRRLDGVVVAIEREQPAVSNAS